MCAYMLLVVTVDMWSFKKGAPFLDAAPGAGCCVQEQSAEGVIQWLHQHADVSSSPAAVEYLTRQCLQVRTASCPTSTRIAAEPADGCLAIATGLCST